MTVQQYSLISGDWLGLEHIINDLATRVIGQIVAPGSSPTFAGTTVNLLTMDAAIPTAIDIGGLYTGSQITLTGTSVTDHAIEIDGVYGAALIYTHTSSATADTLLWGDMVSTATSGDFNGLRPRLTCNAASGGLNARAVYGEVIVGASKYAALTQGLLAHVSYAAGGCHIADIHALGVHISQGASLTATNLYGIIVTVQTRGDETISGDDYMIRLDNEAVGGSGRQMDAAIQIVSTNMSGGIKGYGYGIDFSGGTYATAEIKFSNGETISNLVDGVIKFSGLGTFENITIFNPIPILVFKDSNSVGDASRGFIEWRDSNNTRLGYFGNTSYSNDDLLWKNESSGGHIQVQTTGAGEFQIFANTVLNGDIKTDRWLNQDENTFIGIGVVGAGNLSGNGVAGINNTAIGYNTLYSVTSGYKNTVLGAESLYTNTTGYHNTAVGIEVLYFNVDGTWNTGLGSNALYSNTSGHRNVALGVQALTFNTTGYHNTAVGVHASNANTTGYSNVAVGYQAGYYETGNNKLFIDNQQRASEADGRVKALIYGIFDATVANQSIVFNVGSASFGGADLSNIDTLTANLIDDGAGGTLQNGILSAVNAYLGSPGEGGGLWLLDDPAGNWLKIKALDNAYPTTDRTLSIDLSDADGVLTISGNPIISQNYSASGSPTFTGLTLSGLTQGSIPFAGASGVISQDNAGLFWDNTNKRLGIGTATPVCPIQIEGYVVANPLLGILRFDSNTGANDSGCKIGAVAGVGAAGYAFIQGVRTGIANDRNLGLNTLGGNVGVGTATPAQLLDVNGVAILRDALYFTQTDGDEYIDSLNDGYMDYGATIAHRFDNDIVLPKTSGKGIKVDTTTPTFGWRDLLGDQFAKNTGGTKPTLTTYNETVDTWQFSDGDEAFLTYHIPHDYVPGTDIYLHIHWSQTSATATGGTIDFKYFAIYAKGHNQVSGSIFTSTPITDIFSSIDINDGDSGLNQYQQHITEVIISGASATAALFDRDDFEPDGVIELTLEMDANNLTNSGAVLDPFIHYVDIHYQSTNIGTKDKAPDFYA